ncbi:MAG TPA: hypothetical protein VEM58_05395, partial [Streptosporangiaceae bacterium]|nr:hypothetical protein [Streptosporangiaceae bacterium]
PVLFPVPAGAVGLRVRDREFRHTWENDVSSEETVSRFFAAIEAGDIGTVREIYAPDAVIWHNDDLVEQPVEENLTVLASLHRAVSGLR